MEIEIQCPVHGAIEKIELPDGYREFVGEIACATPIPNHTRGALLKITIVDGKLVSVQRA